MTKEFIDTFKTRQYCLRMGSTVPVNKIGLAYYKCEELSPSNTIQVYDYSRRYPENASVFDNWQSIMQVKDYRLVDMNSNESCPVHNPLITNKFFGDLPLFYSGRLRFFHYEKSPSLNGNTYTGNNIKVLINDSVYTKCTIEVTQRTDIDVTGNVWEGIIYTYDNTSEDVTIKVQYTKFVSSSPYVYVSNFTETFCGEPIYASIGGTSQAIATIKTESNVGKKLYAYENVGNEYFRIYVPEETTAVSRSPITFRWRIVATDGGSTYNSPWTNDSLLNKSSLHSDEYNDESGLVYQLYSTYARKLLASSSRSLFQGMVNSNGVAVTVGANATFALQVNIWNGSTWEADSSNKVLSSSFNSNGSVPIYVYTTEDTGTASQQISSVKKVSKPTYVTIEGYLDTTVSENPVPAYNDDVCPLGSSITVGNNCGVGASTLAIWTRHRRDGFTEEFDGKEWTTPPTYHRITGTLNSIIDGCVSPLLPYGLAAYTAKAVKSAPAVSETVTFTITLPDISTNTAYRISDFDIILGKHGTIDNLVAKSRTGTVLADYKNGPTNGTLSSVTNVQYNTFTARKFNWKLNSTWDPSNPDNITYTSSPQVKTIEVTLAPSQYRQWDWDYFIASILGNCWTSEISFVSLHAWHRKAKVVVGYNWRGKHVVSRNTIKGNIESLDLATELTNNKMTDFPSGFPSAEKNHIRYRFNLGNSSLKSPDGNDIIGGYDPEVNFSLTKQGIKIFKEATVTTPVSKVYDPHNADNVVDIGYSDIFDGSGNSKGIKLNLSSHSYSIEESGKFYIRSIENPHIFILPMNNLSPDTMWFPKINNGIFNVKTSDGTKLEYSLPQFINQPFLERYQYAGEVIPASEIIAEEAQFIDNRHIKVSIYPLYARLIQSGASKGQYMVEDIIVYREQYKDDDRSTRTKINISDINKITGDIYLESDVYHTEKILVDYSYIVESLEYKGFNEGTRFLYLDMNPLPGHQYSLENGTLSDSYNLLTKDIYMYIVPAKTSTSTTTTLWTVRHKIVDAGTIEANLGLPTNSFIIGKILVRNTISPADIKIIDTRKLGGGIPEKYSKEELKKLSNGTFSPDQVLDISSWDGEPYFSNGVIVVTLPKEIKLSESNPDGFVDKEIRDIVNKYISLGIYPIIRFE